MYPEYLDTAYFNGSCPSLSASERQPGRAGTSAVSDSACPHTAAQQIINYLPRILDSNQQTGYISNYTISGRKHARDISVGWTKDNQPGSTVVYATSPMDIVSRELALEGNRQWSKLRTTKAKIALENERYQFTPDGTLDADMPRILVSTSRSRWRQPALAIRCLPSSTNTTHYLVQVPELPFRVPQPAEVPTVRTLGLPKAAFNVTSTPLGVFMDTSRNPPANLTTAFLWSEKTDADTLCLVAAKWAAGNVWISEPNQMTAESSYSVDPNISALAFADPADLITIAPDWANQLDTVLQPQVDPVANSTQNAVGVFERIRATCQHNLQCLSITFGLYLTDALSRHMNSWTVYNCEGDPYLAPLQQLKCVTVRGPDLTRATAPMTPIDDLNQYLSIVTSYYSWQYAYRITGAAESAAWVFLLLHVALVLIHFTEHYVRKRTYEEEDEGWSDVGELVALALKTEPPEYMRDDDSEEKMVTAEPWRLRVYARDEEGRKTSAFIVRPEAWRNARKTTHVR
ncbi:hypothetical protein MFIFM68171_08368 [Madurella fahalii]|uniref:Uncharacterized protein n=1 Tax=Madurella fahalii TaxID=1157608 RepID=A0ABQ0GK68_9PEZI